MGPANKAPAKKKLREDVTTNEKKKERAIRRESHCMCGRY